MVERVTVDVKNFAKPSNLCITEGINFCQCGKDCHDSMESLAEDKILNSVIKFSAMRAGGDIGKYFLLVNLSCIILVMSK
jgi:hypothetical protein